LIECRAIAPESRACSRISQQETLMSINRRLFLSGAAAIGAAGSVPVSVLAQTAPATGQAPGYYRYTIGDIVATAVTDGFGTVPLAGFVKNAPLEEVKKAADEAFFPADSVRIPYTTTVLQIGGKTVLIDTGNGDSGPPTAGRWMANFKAAGFDPAKVDLVVISHFHGDHINGLRLKDGSAVFPNAEVTVSAPEWAFWMDEGNQSRAPDGMKGAFAAVHRVFDPMAKSVARYDGGKEIVSGLTAVATPGHTPGHMSFVVSSGSRKVMLMSDLTNHPSLFVTHPDWAVMFDMDGEMARLTRRRVLDQVAADRLQVAFYHAPFPATGHIAKDGAGFRLVPVQWS
jgi:glyoxylase-like metal-dependent hydrolase (beta-lactamase superfamily II)